MGTITLERPAKHCYDDQGARFFVREVVRNCDNCDDRIIHRRFAGPLVHTNCFTLKRICNE